jgi:hypothetical protein
LTWSVPKLRHLFLVVELRPTVWIASIVQIVFGSEGIDLRQCGGRLAYVELAGDDIDDEPGAVFTNKGGFSIDFFYAFGRFCRDETSAADGKRSPAARATGWPPSRGGREFRRRFDGAGFYAETSFQVPSGWRQAVP